MKPRTSLQIAAPVLAVGVAVLVSGVILSFTKYSAWEVFRVIGTKGFSKIYLVDTVNRAAPYYIAGCAVAVGFKMNLFNIGVEGQYKLAALLAAAAGAAITLPAPLHVVLIFVVAMVVGAAWASVPAILKATRGVSEVISSIMLNAITIGQVFYLLNSRYLLDSSLSLKAHMGNRYLPYGILAVAILQLLFTYTTPFQAMFGNEAVPLWVWPWLLAGGLIFFFVVEAEKFVIRSSDGLRTAVTAVEAGT